MGKLIDHCRMGGTCYSCGGEFRKGDPIWWAGYGKARHPGCPEQYNFTTSDDAGPRPTAFEYLFVDPKGSSKFDQLPLATPAEALVKAFELSVTNNQAIGVSRIEDGKAVSLFMISAVPGATLVPVPKIGTEVAGPLFEWTGDGLPF